MPTNDTCTGTTLASTSVAEAPASNATTSYQISVPTQDDVYGAYGYIIDNHGFEATGGQQGVDSILTVSNVAPTVASSTITLDGGTAMTLTVDGGETTGFALQFVASDNNTCQNSTLGDEIVGYELSLYRSGIGSTGCSATTTTDYNPNNCYQSNLATTTWNLSCTASSTSCAGGNDTTQVWDCTFPLWYVADPTVVNTQYPTENWLAQVSAIDDNSATGTASEVETGVDMNILLAFGLNTLTIPYGSLEPGQQMDPIVATTTISARGNAGLDKDVQGTSMCTTYSGATPCNNSSSSTISASEQVFATSTVTYASGTALSSTTPQEIEINVPKSTATSSQATANAFWGIRVPSAITFSGNYSGENTFTAILGEIIDW